METDDGCEAAYLCLGSVGAGHVEVVPPADSPDSVATGTPTPSGMTDEQKAERRKVVSNNKAWETANPVRWAYLAELLVR